MRSLTQLAGSTTQGQYPGSFADLSQNNATANVARGVFLINNRHRYYLQKYFDNERTYTTTTIGAQSLTTTAVVTVNSTSATLTASWSYITCQQLVVFSNSEQRTVTFTQGSTNIAWQTGLTSQATTAITTVGVQFYPIPANVSKIKNDTITVGQLVYTPAPIQSIQEWTMLNALPYTSNIPGYFYIYQNQVGFFPIPSSTGNIITFNYKSRVADMTYTDYATGTVSGVTVGSNAITGVGSLWTSFPTNIDLSYANLMISMTPPNGDGLWYPIQRFTGASSLLLNLPIVNAPNSASVYVVGQFPLLSEDFHDLLVYSSLKIYYSSIVKDKERFQLFDALTKEGEAMMAAYLANKSVNVDLGAQPLQSNPNLYLFANS